MRTSLALLGLLLIVLPLRAQDDPGGFEVHDRIVLVYDALKRGANTVQQFRSTIPDSIAKERRNAPRGEELEPCPIGVISFHGDAPETLEVAVGYPSFVVRQEGEVVAVTANGKFLGTWPGVLLEPEGIRWRRLRTSRKANEIFPTHPHHWFSQLRQVDALYLTGQGNNTERFLLYDVSVPFGEPFEFEGKGEADVAQPKLVNRFGYPLHDIRLHRPTIDGGWSTAVVGTVDAGATSAEIVYDDESVTPPTALISGWQEPLEELGLAPGEAGHLVDLLERYGVHSRYGTAIFRLDRATLDEILPLEVTPKPDRVIRVGLVVVLRADPIFGGSVESLVERLGSERWIERERAEQALQRLGNDAKAFLKQVVDHPDPEIAYRVERILRGIETGTFVEGMDLFGDEGDQIRIRRPIRRR